jgi:hypothetical protein
VSVDVALSGFSVVIGPMPLAFDELRGHFLDIVLCYGFIFYLTNTVV